MWKQYGEYTGMRTDYGTLNGVAQLPYWVIFLLILILIRSYRLPSSHPHTTPSHLGKFIHILPSAQVRTIRCCILLHRRQTNVLSPPQWILAHWQLQEKTSLMNVPASPLTQSHRCAKSSTAHSRSELRKPKTEERFLKLTFRSKQSLMIVG